VKKGRISVLILVFLFLAPAIALGDEFTSTNFKVLDPVLAPGGYSSSTSYQLTGVITQIAIGTSTITDFNVSGGFLFFPFASSPTVTATAGDGQVSLSWTSSSGLLGWTVSGYNVGQSTTSGGPYTYTSSLGNVTSSTRTGLSNGTTYYFVVRTEDIFGNAIATSSEASATPAAAETTAASTAKAGGGHPLLVSPWIPPEQRLEQQREILERERARIKIADFNKDNTIDVVDLSAILYFLGKPITIASPFDLNNDRKVNLIDLSILFSLWTEENRFGQPQQLSASGGAEIVKNPADGSRLVVLQPSSGATGVSRETSLRSRHWLSWSEWQPVSGATRVEAGVWAIQLKSSDADGLTSIKILYLPEEIVKKLSYILLLALLGIILAKGRLLKWYNRNK